MPTRASYKPPATSGGARYAGVSNTTAGAIRYFMLNTSNFVSTTESLAQTALNDITLNTLYVNVATFTYGGTYIVTLRVNGAPTALTLTIGALGVATISSPVIITAGDLVNLELDASLSGGGTSRLLWELS